VHARTLARRLAGSATRPLSSHQIG
jgi:hypothetical protein